MVGRGVKSVAVLARVGNRCLDSPGFYSFKRSVSTATRARERPDKSYQMAGRGTFTPGLPLQWDVDYWKVLNSGMLHHLNLVGNGRVMDP